jgi:hypothetical protein
MIARCICTLDKEVGMAAEPNPARERRSGERRSGLRRQEDRRSFARAIASALIAICGGLVALFLFLGAIGAFHFDQAAAASGAAAGLGLIWFLVFLFRTRAGAAYWAQRPDRERRGF